MEAINRIIYNQGKAQQARLGNLTREITAHQSGTISAINNQRINQLGILAGANQYAGAGLDLLKKVGDTVETGEPLYIIHSTNSNDFALANSAAESNSGYEIS